MLSNHTHVHGGSLRFNVAKRGMVAVQQLVQPILPYLGILLIFTAVPLTMVLRGMTSWGMVLVLALMNSAAVWWVVLEDRYEERLLHRI